MSEKYFAESLITPLWSRMQKVCAVLGLLSIFVGVQGQTCGNVDIARCNSILLEHVPSSYIKVYTSEELMEYCTAAGKFKTCIERIFDACSDDLQVTIKDALNSDGYLCSSEGRRLMAHSYDCFQEDDTQDAVYHNCSGLSRKYMDDNHSDTDRCDNLHRFLKCVKDIASSTCGQEAGNFLHQLQVKAVENLSKSLQCTISSSACNQLSSVMYLIALATIIVQFV